MLDQLNFVRQLVLSEYTVMNVFIDGMIGNSKTQR
jgi:hypothetical protein